MPQGAENSQKKKYRLQDEAILEYQKKHPFLQA